MNLFTKTDSDIKKFVVAKGREAGGKDWDSELVDAKYYIENR